MPIQKATLLVTVYAEYDAQDDFAKQLTESELERVAFELAEGQWVGTHELRGIETVPPEDVRKELIAIGNDGTFFDREG